MSSFSGLISHLLLFGSLVGMSLVILGIALAAIRDHFFSHEHSKAHKRRLGH